VTAVGGVQGGARGGEGVSEDPAAARWCAACGGMTAGGVLRETWGLDLATLRWEAMPALLSVRYVDHACCAVRGALVVLGGAASGGGGSQGLAPTSRVEMLSEGAGAFVELPPLSCGAIYGAAAITVDESDSTLG